MDNSKISYVVNTLFDFRFQILKMILGAELILSSISYELLVEYVINVKWVLHTSIEICHENFMDKFYE